MALPSIGNFLTLKYIISKIDASMTQLVITKIHDKQLRKIQSLRVKRIKFFL